MSAKELRKHTQQPPLPFDGHAKQANLPIGRHAGEPVPLPTVFENRPSLSLLDCQTLRRAFVAGTISENRMLDEFARLGGLQRVDLDLTGPDQTLAAQFDGATCLRLQCLPWRISDGVLWVATSSPEHFETASKSLASSHHPILIDLPKIQPVLAPRKAIQQHLATHHRTYLTKRMARRPPAALSARHWSGRFRILAVAAMIAMLATFLFTAAAAIPAALIGCAIAAVAVATLLKLSAAIAHLSPHKGQEIGPSPPDLVLPTVSILVPLYHETGIANALLKRLEKLDYPGEKLEILLILEESDALTRRAIDAAQLPPWMHVITVPDGKPRTKPRAMNYALDFASGEIIGVYDAEDAPDPDQIRKVVNTFATTPPKVACLQGALDYYNPRQNWITRCFTVEYNTWFRLIMPGMARLGFALPLGGTTIFFRRNALEEVGAWDAHNVTEDADLGMRLARFGYLTKVIDTTTKEEASAHPIQWVRQRSRWLKGYLMTYAVHMRRPRQLLRDLGPWQFIGFQAHFLTAILHFTLAPLLWVFWLVLFGIDLPLIQFDTSNSMIW